MKKAFLFLAFCGALAAAKAQTADDIVNKHIDALGGKEKLASLKTMVREGSLNYQGMDLPLTLTGEQNKGFKMELNVMGTKYFRILTATEGWSYMPQNSGTEKMTEEQVKEGQDDLDIQGELFDYAAKGHKVELLGKEKLDGAEVYKLKLTPKSGVAKTIYIDAATYYISKVVVVEKDKTSEVSFSNYKKSAEGFVFPYTMVRMEGEIGFTKITANPKLADSAFKPEN